MSRILRAVVLTAALISALAATTSSAGAVTWHNSGDTAFTATAGSFTFQSTGLNYSCASQDLWGTAPAAPGAGLVYRMTLTTLATGCGGSLTIQWECSRTFTATARSGDTTIGFADTTCGVYLGGPPSICSIQGTVPATYTEPTPPSTTGRFYLPTSNSLVATGGSCLLGNNDPVTVLAQNFGIVNATGGPSPHLGPVIARTA